MCAEFISMVWMVADLQLMLPLSTKIQVLVIEELKLAQEYLMVLDISLTPATFQI
jgi:hypothetical protein